MTEPKKKRTTPTRTREDWADRKWRPAMGWMYLVVCITDFIVFPVLHAWFQSQYGTATLAWDPLTLKGGGLFHVAMGAVLGVAAWSRGQEKITKYRTGYYNQTSIDDGYGNVDEVDETIKEVPSETKESGFYRYRG